MEFTDSKKYNEIFRAGCMSMNQGLDLVSRQDWNYNYYRTLAFMPAVVHSLLMVTRYDITSLLTWLTEAGLISLGVFATRHIHKEKSKSVKHLLISPSYQEVIIGVDNLGSRILGETLPPHVAPVAGCTYSKVALENVLFFGYSQVFQSVKNGSSLSDAEAKMKVALDNYSKDPSLIGEIMKLGFNKRKLLLTLVYYDKEENKYVEVEIDQNANSLEELDDYLAALLNKQKMKFFVDHK